MGKVFPSRVGALALLGLGMVAFDATSLARAEAPTAAAHANAPAANAPAANAPATKAEPSPREEWNVPHEPFHIFGSVYFVGVQGLSSILITSPHGHILIDGDLPESVPNIVKSIRALGFRIEDVKLILNSHDHYDHAGGIAELQRLSGAQVAASPSTARALTLGHVDRDDPQFSSQGPLAQAKDVRVLHDGETLHVGSLSVTAHFTPGHTPGGTSWSWNACEEGHCKAVVYADSLTPISDDDFLFTKSKDGPRAVEDFHHSYAVLKSLPCDILLTPHPDASGMWERLAKAAHVSAAEAWSDSAACAQYAAAAEQKLEKRLAQERGEAKP